MIIENGTIEFKEKTASGIDPTTGYPVRPSEVRWGRRIACQFSANKYNNLGKTSEGGHFTMAQYEILVDEQPIVGEQLRLTDDKGRVRGEFSIMEVEPLPAVCELRILV